MTLPEDLRYPMGLKLAWRLAWVHSNSRVVVGRVGRPAELGVIRREDLIHCFQNFTFASLNPFLNCSLEPACWKMIPLMFPAALEKPDPKSE